MTQRVKGAATKSAPRPRSGMHVLPRISISGTRAELALWDRAAAKTLAGRAEWARHCLTVDAAEELGLDVMETLRKVRP